MKDALALALVHFIWQGAVLAIVGAVLMRVTKVPAVRYAIGVATMVAMLAAPAMTFLAIRSSADAAPRTTMNPGTIAGAAAANRALMTVPPAVEATQEDASSVVIVPTTWILNVWAVGVMVLSLRFAGGWAMARRLATQKLRPVSEELQALSAQMAARLNVRGVVRVCESASVAVPVMIGWLRPVIVLPPAAMAALPLAQLEALLAHELAHIRRHDYLVNLLQTGVETLYFYHPAVWWISREVRRQREHCCDDLAVGVCDRLTYVTALSSLASISTPQFALSAAGGSLRDRVRRLIEPTTHSASPKGAWIAMLPILLVVSFVAPHAWGDQSAPATAPVVTVGQAAVPTAQAKPVPSVVPPVPVEVQRRRVTTRVTPRVERRVAAPVTAETAARPRVRTVAPTTTRTIERRAPVQAREARAPQATDAARRNQEQEMARTIRERRAGLEVQAEQLAARQELAALQSELRRQEMELERSKQLVEKGLAAQETRARAEEQVAHARRQLEAAKTHLDLKEQEHVLRRAEVDLERRAHLETRVERAEHLNLSVLDAAASLQPQDVLTIAIADEPDLPTHFTVRTDGSIRFPLLGAIRVQGSTTGQVQSAIQKLITDKGLARNPAVTVAARRAR